MYIDGRTNPGSSVRTHPRLPRPDPDPRGRWRRRRRTLQYPARPRLLRPDPERRWSRTRACRCRNNGPHPRLRHSRRSGLRRRSSLTYRGGALGCKITCTIWIWRLVSPGPHENNARSGTCTPAVSCLLVVLVWCAHDCSGHSERANATMMQGTIANDIQNIATSTA